MKKPVSWISSLMKWLLMRLVNQRCQHYPLENFYNLLIWKTDGFIKVQLQHHHVINKCIGMSWAQFIQLVHWTPRKLKNSSHRERAYCKKQTQLWLEITEKFKQSTVNMWLTWLQIYVKLRRKFLSHQLVRSLQPWMSLRKLIVNKWQDITHHREKMFRMLFQHPNMF